MASNPENRPRFVEPRRALVKAMALRAKTSHSLGAFQILPEHVLLSCLAQLPRDDHDAVADCSTGFRALMRSERFLKARRAEDITEEALVAVTRDGVLLTLVSRRMWRHLAPMPAEMRVDCYNASRFHGITAIGSELFVAGGLRQNGSYAVAVHDAVDDSWFSLPLPPSLPRNRPTAIGCAGRLFVGGLDDTPVGLPIQVRYRFNLWAWDADDQEWVSLPRMPLSMGYPQDTLLAAVAVGSEIFICHTVVPKRFCVFDVEAETWRRVEIPVEAWYYGEHSVSLFVDEDLIHILHHRNGEVLGNVHRAYDTVNEEWIRITGGLPRHTASSESRRVHGIINYDGPDDFLYASETSSSGSVRIYYSRRSGGSVQWSDRGHDVLGYVIDLPVRYDAIARVASVAMP